MSTNAPSTFLWDPGRYDYQRKLGNFVQYFQVNLPTNSHGVPMQLIDPLPIAENMLDCETTDDIPEHVVEQAILHVDFEEGVPVVEGTPIWERLDGEQVDYYKLFKEYREMLYISGTRAISKLAAQHNVVGKNLSALAKVYHWSLRAKAFDAYKQAESVRKRSFEIEKVESRHSKAARLLTEKALEYFENHPEQMNPKIALEMLKLGMKTERLSVGLNPDKPGAGDGTPSISIQTTNNSGEGGSTTTIEVGNNGKKEQSQDLSYLQSIVHILDKTGALDKAKQNVIDADFEEVD